jgi:hypothetical protein
MSEIYIDALEKFKLDKIHSFDYLDIANQLLANPAYQVFGRDLVIRALDQRRRFENEEVLLRALVRKSGLYPYLQSEFQNRTLNEEFAVGVYRAEHDRSFVYHAVQLKVLNFLRSGRNVVLSAPTSMGKSAIIDSLIGSEKYTRIVIVVPSIALIDETRRRVAKKFSEKYDVISHNSQVVKEGRSTIFVLTQERVNERDDLSKIDLFVIDEFYKLAFKPGEPDERVIALNICLSKLLSVSKQFYMIGPSIEQVRGLNRFGRSFVFIPANFNTVAIDVKEYNLGANDREAKMAALRKILDPTISGKSAQTIVYCKSPGAATEIVHAMISANLGRKTRSDYVDWIKENYGDFWIYAKAVQNGIGVHHGSLPRAIQQYTVDLFNAKILRILICTSTIIEGVNTNAEEVVVFDNRNGTGSIDRFTHNNIKGRAGRMSKHFVGTVHCLESIPEDTYKSKVVDVPLGLQTASSPPNLLAGINDEHVQEPAISALRDYVERSNFPLWLLRKFPSYKVDQLRDLYDNVNFFSNYEMKQVCSRKPNAAQIDLMCKALRIVELASLKRCSIQGNDSDLKLKFSRYLFASSHQSYLNSIVEWIVVNYNDDDSRSLAMDRDLKIIRNIFGFAVPRMLSLLQDIINLICLERRYNFFADYSYARAQFENQHLPGCFGVLEEMGVPVQTLAKIATGEVISLPLDEVLIYLRKNVNVMNSISNLEKDFIGRALFG